MKRFLIFIISLLMIFFIGCGDVSDDKNNNSRADYVKITFLQAGKEDIVKTIIKGEALNDIPIPEQKKGYEIIWDRSDFSSITEDIIVNISENAKTYKITYKLGKNNDAKLSDYVQYVTYDSEFELLLPEYNNRLYEFSYWKEEKTGKKYEDSIFRNDCDITLVAEWVEFSELV